MVCELYVKKTLPNKKGVYGIEALKEKLCYVHCCVPSARKPSRRTGTQ